MRGEDIVNKLRQDLTKYTKDFNDEYNIISLTALNGVVTASLPSHPFQNGAYVRITGAKESINISNISINGNIATVTTAKDHKLIDPSIFTKESEKIKYNKVTIENITPIDFNGEWEILQVIDGLNFTFKIDSNPSNPTAYGNILVNDFEGLNGYKEINVIDSNNISYSISDLTISGQAGGTIKLYNSNRIDNAISLDRAIEHYKGTNKGTRMYIVIGDDETYRNGTTLVDVTALKNTNETERLESQRNLSIYIFTEVQNTILAGNSADQTRGYIYPLLKTLVNVRFSSFLSEEFYQPLQYQGGGFAGYDTTYYIHEFSFTAKGYINIEDTAEFNIGTPLKEIRGQDDKGLEYNVKYS